MPDNPAGVETELLEEIIAKVEQHLDESEYLLLQQKKTRLSVYCMKRLSKKKVSDWTRKQLLALIK